MSLKFEALLLGVEHKPLPNRTNEEFILINVHNVQNSLGNYLSKKSSFLINQFPSEKNQVRKFSRYVKNEQKLKMCCDRFSMASLKCSSFLCFLAFGEKKRWKILFQVERKRLRNCFSRQTLSSLSSIFSTKKRSDKNFELFWRYATFFFLLLRLVREFSLQISHRLDDFRSNGDRPKERVKGLNLPQSRYLIMTLVSKNSEDIFTKQNIIVKQ